MTKDSEELNFPDNIGYTPDHIWIKQEEDRYTSGITDFAQDQLGEIIYMDLPEIGDFFEAEEVFCIVESMKTIFELFMPISGEILAVHNSLEDEPEIINQDPYGKGWLIKIKLSDITEIQQLLTAETYAQNETK
jgi:glycine cleavage system H protein